MNLFGGMTARQQAPYLPLHPPMVQRREQLHTALRILRGACDQIEREGMCLEDSSRWVTVHADSRGRIERIQVDMRFIP